MPKDFQQIAAEVDQNAVALRGLVPDVMTGFAGLGKAAYKAGVLDTKTKELIALALGVAARCDGCLAHHSRTLARLGATREEVAEAIGVAIHMGGGPSMIYAGEALRAFDSFKG